jgi:hypothetical protein
MLSKEVGVLENWVHNPDSICLDSETSILNVLGDSLSGSLELNTLSCLFSPLVKLLEIAGHLSAFNADVVRLGCVDCGGSCGSWCDCCGGGHSKLIKDMVLNYNFFKKNTL